MVVAPALLEYSCRDALEVSRLFHDYSSQFSYISDVQRGIRARCIISKTAAPMISFSSREIKSELSKAFDQTTDVVGLQQLEVRNNGARFSSADEAFKIIQSLTPLFRARKHLWTECLNNILLRQRDRGTAPHCIALIAQSPAVHLSKGCRNHRILSRSSPLEWRRN